ncbi:hypothetical protein [Leeuwenhoekiella blandensis]|uniref:hypothetical protein n=1 Tax=Leeuwenhoekiella blandensis TaxID=360293 RepID=UPI002356B4FD|nr:hypothetical protein [Leeuwenhoekiella blandensis]
MAEKRKYTKRSDYWNKLKEKHEQSLQDPLGLAHTSNASNYQPELIGESFYNHESKAYARSGGPGSSTTTRRNNIAIAPKLFKYNNIRAGMLPYEYGLDGVNVRDAIELTQKAYANIAVFRNAVDMMADFANSTLYLEGGSAKSRSFVNAWLKKIKIWNLKDQFFREFYRSGNVFLYTIEGKINVEDFSKVRNFGLTLKTNKLPVRYILLNPFDIVAKRATSFDIGLYAKVLSEYEAERLKNPKTDEDRELYESLDPDIKLKIAKDSWALNGLKEELDPEKLRYAFYKKQDYEPFAVPFGFPVLDDIEFKMEMKKIDQSICRTIENVVLMITMGTTPDKGGVNPRNIRAMQSLFQNQSVGRILVSDYTTKAEFIIPDIQKVIGPAKYEVVNQDIKEGLQNIILSQEKFASTEIKAQMFLQRLKESRDAFLNTFLQPEIKQLCKNYGFKNAPVAKFETIDLQDQTQVQRTITRMMELGILPPEEGIKVIETGVFPKGKELEAAQEKFVEDRQKGYYNPIVGGQPMPMTLEEDMEVEEMKHPKGAEILNKPQNRARSASNPGRPLGSKTLAKECYSVTAIKETADKTNDLYNSLATEAKKVFKKKRLNKNQKEMLERVCESVVVSKDKNDWLSTGKACIADPQELIKLQPMEPILKISSEHELDDYAAAILHHSRKNSLNK